MALNRTDASPIAYTRGSKEILDPTNDTLGTQGSKGTQSELESTQGTKDTRDTLQPLKSDLYLTDELDDIERSIGSLTRFVPQVADVEPSELYKGLIRYCKSPWDPIGTGYEGLVTYDGSTWSKLGDYDAAIDDLQAQITSNDGDISDLQANKADASHTHAYTDINGIDSGRLLGRTTASSGAAELITLGTGLSFTGTTLNGSSGSKIIRTWLPTDASFPPSNYPTLDTRNTHPVLDFDPNAYEWCFFHGAMPDNYVTGDTVYWDVWYSMTSATSNNVVVLARLEKMTGFNINGDGFTANWNGGADTVPNVAGVVKVFSFSASGVQLAGLTANDLFRFQLLRSGPAANDTAPGDMEVHMVRMRIQ